MNNVLILLDNLDDWKPYYETSSVLTVSDYLKNRLAEFAAFAAVGVVGLGINAAIIWFFKDILASKLIFGTLLPQDKYYLVGKLVSTVIVFIWNFAGRKFIIFDKNKD